jgi:hypothetical protein
MNTFLTGVWLWAEHLTARLFGLLTLGNLLRVWVRFFSLGLLGLVLPITILVWAVTGDIQWAAIRAGVGITFFLSATLIMGPALRLLGIRDARMAWLGIGVLIAILAVLAMAANDYLAAPFDRIAILGLIALLLLILWGRRRAVIGLWIIPWVLIIIGIVGGIYMNPKVQEEAKKIDWPTLPEKPQTTTVPALPDQWQETLVLNPGEPVVIRPRQLVGGTRRNIAWTDPTGCMEIWVSGRSYVKDCPGGPYFAGPTGDLSTMVFVGQETEPVTVKVTITTTG